MRGISSRDETNRKTNQVRAIRSFIINDSFVFVCYFSRFGVILCFFWCFFLFFVFNFGFCGMLERLYSVRLKDFFIFFLTINLFCCIMASVKARDKPEPKRQEKKGKKIK